MMKSGKAATKKATAAVRVVQEPEVATPQATAPESEIDRLGTMSIGELQRLYAEVVGQPTKCPTRSWLVRKIVEAAVLAAPAGIAATDEAEATAGPDG